VNSDVDSSAEQAIAWLQQCKSHVSCPELRVPLLPTRVLDISNDNIRLHIPRGARSHYLALRYCWGGPQPVRTLAGNIERHRTGIQTSDLPQTPQDAITFARRLSIRYMWIDALCILQDSPEDKGKEIAKMASIYQNSLLTIAATSASTCTEGFLSDREPPIGDMLIENLPWTCQDGNTGQISLHRQSDYRVDQEPLNQRAWTLQERLLSPRVLSFGSQGLVWECQTTRCTAGGSSALAYDMGVNRLEPYIFSPLTAATMKESPKAFRTRYTWQNTVMDLTRRKMSEESDKLPAISGVALQVHLITGDTYLAGLWKHWLLFELFWLLDPEDEDFGNTRRPTTYRAPSWS
jgi:hypothetical protein